MHKLGESIEQQLEASIRVQKGVLKTTGSWTVWGIEYPEISRMFVNGSFWQPVLAEGRAEQLRVERGAGKHTEAKKSLL